MKCRYEWCVRTRVKDRSVCAMCLARVRRYRRKQQGLSDARPVRRWAPETNPKEKARHSVFVALRRGSLRRPTACAKCKRACTPEADHHRGYGPGNRLRVWWLCRTCHRAVEVVRNRIRRSLVEIRMRLEALLAQG